MLIVCAAAPLVAQTRRPYATIHYGGNYLHNYLIPPAPASTPWAPAWAPDGKQIAVGWRGSIWTIELASGIARELTAGPTYHSSPTWSPDGRWIVYTADNGGRSIHLEAVDVISKDSHPLTLTSDEVATIDPRFSPDGSRIAYVSSEPNGFLNIFVRPFANGSWTGEAIAVTEDSNTRSGVERPYFTDQDLAIAPAWTPDGASLVFVSNHGVALGSGHIVKAPAVARGIAQPIVREQTLYHASRRLARWTVAGLRLGARRARSVSQSRAALAAYGRTAHIDALRVRHLLSAVVTGWPPYRVSLQRARLAAIACV